MAFKIKDGVRIGTKDVFNSSGQLVKKVELIDTSSSNVLTLDATLSAARTQNFQDASGTIALTSDIGAGVLTVAGNSGLTGSGTFSANDFTNKTITISHADTSSVVDLTAVTNTFIAGQTYDTYGHVLTRTTGAVDFTVAANYAFQNISIGADSGYTWGTANANTTQAADSSSDTVTFVRGLTGTTAGIDLFTSTVAGTDAIKIAHADTSALTGIQGSTGIAAITVDEMGHVTGVTTTTYDNYVSWTAQDGDTTAYSIAAGNTLQFVEGNGIDVNFTGTRQLTFTNTGVLSLIGTANEIEVSSSVGNVTVGLPDNVTVTKDLVVGGNLTVSGTVTTVNTETINLADNIITLNSNFTASTATEDAGLEIERGGQPNVLLLWNETSDRWTFTNDGTTYYNIPVPADYKTYTISAVATTSGAFLRLTDSSSTTDDVRFSGSTYTTVARIDDDTIQITSTFATYALSTEANGTYSKNIRLTSSGAISATDDITLEVGQTDSIYGLGIAEAGDTITFTHANTSALSGTYGTAGIKSIGVDGMGHITGVTTDTYLTSQSTDFKTITVSDTDSGFTWAATGSAAAEIVGDTLTVVSGRGIDVDVDATNDAIRISSAGSSVAFTEANSVVTVTLNTITVVNSFPHASYKSAKYLIQVVQGAKFQTSEVLVVHDGVTTYMTEFAVIESSSLIPITTTSAINGANVELRVTITDAASTNAKVSIQRTLMAVPA